VAAGALLLLGGCSDGSSSDGAAPATAAPVAGVAEPDLIVPIEGRPSAIAYGAGVLWVADDGTGVVHRLDPADGTPLGPPIPVTSAPVAVEVGAGRAWVVDPSGTLTGIDLGAPSEPALSVELGGALVDVAVDGEHVWVGDIGAGTVRSVDASTGALSAPLPVPGGVVRLALDEDRLWVSGLEDAVTPIDLPTGPVGEPLTVGVAPIGMAVGDGSLWVANSEDDTVTHLRGGGPGTGPAWAVGPAPIELALVGGDVWVLEQDAPALTRYRGDGEVVSSVPLPTRPRGLVRTPAGIWIAGVDESVVVLVRT
jgi:streptogramin lyase